MSTAGRACRDKGGAKRASGVTSALLPHPSQVHRLRGHRACSSKQHGLEDSWVSDGKQFGTTDESKPSTVNISKKRLNKRRLVGKLLQHMGFRQEAV